MGKRSASVLKINNRDARRLWLCATGLARNPTGPVDVIGIIRDLGFVQIDTVRNVTRAHHHILWSRNQNYREKMLWPQLADKKALFEHFTHDASLIPMEFYPKWAMQFHRLGQKVAKWHKSALVQDELSVVYDRIEAEGPLSTHAFDTKIDGARKMWTRPPHKKALERLWYAGKLATSHRINFSKFYDLAERVIPEKFRSEQLSELEQMDWLNKQALARLSFANAREIKQFWDVLTAQEVNNWLEVKGDVLAVEVEGVNGKFHRAYAPAHIEDILVKAQQPTSRLRIINPFDPAIRDRDRLGRLFGFEYRNEMFVPKADRKWGYYVYPLLQGHRFVGRIEIKANRGAGQLNVTGFWAEKGVNWSARRRAQLQSELERFARFAGTGKLVWQARQFQ